MKVLLDLLCDPASLLHVPDHLLHGGSKVARVICSARTHFAEYYAITHSNDYQPQYNCDGNLQYIKSINRNIWEAQLTTDEGVIVKFTTQYSSDVHKCLCDIGMAPKLIDMQELAGGWKFIQMEKIESKTLHDMYFGCSSNATQQKQKDVIKKQLQRAVSHNYATTTFCPWGSADTEHNDRRS